MNRFALVVLVAAGLAIAGGFKFAIGSPVAAQEPAAKMAAFVFRTEGCAEPAQAQITATAEGMVRGARKSQALKVTAMQRPGVYAVFQTWEKDGQWVVVLNGSCEAEAAGAIVPIGPKGFVRESAKFFPSEVPGAEIEASLKSLAKGESR